MYHRQRLPIKKYINKIICLSVHIPSFLIFLWLVASLCWQQILYQRPMLFPDPPTLAHYTLTATTCPPTPPRRPFSDKGDSSGLGQPVTKWHCLCHSVLCGPSSPPWVPGVRGLCCKAAHLPPLALLNLILRLYQRIWETGS